MKKVLCICMALALLVCLPVTVSAAEAEVKLTADSSYAVGGTAEVDIAATAQSVMMDDSIGADMYNAAMEQNMTVVWKCSNGNDKYGNSVTWTDADVGREYICNVAFYADAELTEMIDIISGEPFVVTQGAITPEGPLYFTEGVPCYYQLSCNIEGVTLENFRTSLPPGLEIDPDGLIHGTPTQEGFWFVTVVAYKDGEPVADEGYEIYVQAPSLEPPMIVTESLPEAVVGESYYAQIDDGVADATVEVYYNPGRANDFEKTGLKMDTYGVISGTPTQAGSYTFTVVAVNDGGEDYATFTLVVKEGAEPTEPIASEPAEEPHIADPDDEDTQNKEETPEKTEDNEDKNEKEERDDRDEEDGEDEEEDTIWLYIAIGAGSLILGAVIALGVMLLVKKAKKQ